MTVHNGGSSTQSIIGKDAAGSKLTLNDEANAAKPPPSEDHPPLEVCTTNDEQN